MEGGKGEANVEEVGRGGRLVRPVLIPLEEEEGPLIFVPFPSHRGAAHHSGGQEGGGDGSGDFSRRVGGFR